MNKRLLIVKIGAIICGAIVIAGVAFVLSLVICGTAKAQERYSDPDKKLHFAAGAVIGAGTTIYTKSAASGALVGCAVGVAKEAYDAVDSKRHTATAKDVIATCLGAAVGAGAGFIVTPNAVMWEFKF